MKKYNITVNGTTYAVEVEEVGGAASAAPAAPAPAAPAAAPAPAAPAPAAAPAGGADSVTAPGAETINAPMPGNIVNVMVKAGDTVAKGQVLLVLEAMKMENEITAVAAGTVDTVPATKGAAVNAGDVLVTFK